MSDQLFSPLTQLHRETKTTSKLQRWFWHFYTVICQLTSIKYINVCVHGQYRLHLGIHTASPHSVYNWCQHTVSDMQWYWFCTWGTVV